jgi:hypothetical protein
MTGFLARLAVAAQGLLILWMAVCPVLSAPAGASAAAPVSETENEEEEKTAEVRSAVEWVAPPRADRRSVEPAPAYLAFLPPARPVPSPSKLLRPTAADPFANGLGSPYRP